MSQGKAFVPTTPHESTGPPNSHGRGARTGGMHAPAHIRSATRGYSTASAGYPERQRRRSSRATAALGGDFGLNTGAELTPGQSLHPGSPPRRDGFGAAPLPPRGPAVPPGGRRRSLQPPPAPPCLRPAARGPAGTTSPLRGAQRWREEGRGGELYIYGN